MIILASRARYYVISFHFVHNWLRDAASCVMTKYRVASLRRPPSLREKTLV